MQGVRFVVAPSLGMLDRVLPLSFHLSCMSDPSLRDLVERILPLATYYTGITSFIEMRSHLDFGLVNHALCAALRDMLKVRRVVLCTREAYLLDRYLLGLSNTPCAARARFQYLATVLASEVVVLRSSHAPYTLYPLSSHHRTRHSRRSFRLGVLIQLSKHLGCRRGSTQRGSRLRWCEAQGSSEGDRQGRQFFQWNCSERWRSTCDHT